MNIFLGKSRKIFIMRLTDVIVNGAYNFCTHGDSNNKE